MIELKPLSIKDIPKAEDFAVFDIESSNWINFLIAGFYDGKTYKDFLSMHEFLKYIFSDKNKRNIIYAHFGGNFDFLFVLKEVLETNDFQIISMLNVGNGLLSLKVFKPFKYGEKYNPGSGFDDSKCNGRVIEFRDSSKLLPFSLRALCESFDVKHKKLDTDYLFTKVTENLKKYLEYDCKGLFEVLEKYRTWPLIRKAGTAHTMASQALRVLRTFLQEPIYGLNPRIDSFIRKAYFGGRTEIFRPVFKSKKGEKLFCYDVNSLYPTVMRENYFPNAFKGVTYKYLKGEIGFYDCIVTVPEMYIPPLAKIAKINKSDKLIFPIGTFRGTWSTVELEYAQSLGVKIEKIFKGYIFNNGGYIFKNYIDALYDIRLKAQKNSVDSMLAKLLMNSCYGRFGLNLEKEELVFDDGGAVSPTGVKIPVNLKRLYKNDRKHYRLKCKFAEVRLATKRVHLDKSFTNVAIAAWVTSLARVFMHKIYVEHEKQLFYTDTDSIFTTKKIKDSKGLGGLKEEYAIDTAACFLLPKTYMVKNSTKIFKDSKGTLTDQKIVMKGFGKQEVSQIDSTAFFEAIEGDLRRLKAKSPPKMAKLRTALRKGNLLTLLPASSRSIHSLYDKRKIVKSHKNYDTIPLKVFKGKISDQKSI